MATTNQDYEMYEYEDKQLTFNILDENGTAKDLTGGTANFVIVSTSINKTVGNGITISTSTVNVFLSKTDTLNMHGQYDYELRVADSNEMSAVVATGKFTIHKSYTVPSQT